ncbi:MAG: PhoH family protein [Candidatus Babeliales bacterium]
MTKNKLYLIDTNVLMHDPDSIFSFKGASVGIPLIVLEELDRFKTETSERGHNARQSIRYLDTMRAQGSLRNGVPLARGGTLQVYFPPDRSALLQPLDEQVSDNIILLTAQALKDQGHDVVFISKDLNARVKADALGINAQDYLKGQVSPEQFYHGWVHIEVPALSLKSEQPPELQLLLIERGVTVNEYVLVSSRSNPYNFRIFRYTARHEFKEIGMPHLEWPLEARNPQQLMALDLLFDDEIQLITLIGGAGTGKTFLALLAGLHQVLLGGLFEKMLISRPVVPLGPDIGFLPGTIEEKLHSWMQPIYDNMDFLVHSINMQRRDLPSYEMVYADHRRGMRHNNKQHHNNHNGHHKKDRRASHDARMESIDELVRKGKISMEAITYMRGRSIPYQFILIDEVQNVTPHEVKTLISRVGEGSKIILAGDPYQIDSPYLDFSSNGLIVAASKFKGQSLFGSVYLESSERSQLSKLVGELW